LNFLIWGLYHGTLLVFERALKHRFGWTLNGVAGTAATLILVTIGWVFFRVETWSAAVTTLRAMVGLGAVSGPVEMPVGYYLAPDILSYLAIALVVAFVPAGRLGQWQPDRTGVLAVQLFGALAVFCYSALLLAANSFNPFIYFRF
jgi:alginate O-acetyltransferase complex protein AlgI